MRFTEDDLKKLGYDSNQAAALLTEHAKAHHSPKTHLMTVRIVRDTDTRLKGVNKTERRFYDRYLAALPKNSVIVQPARFWELEGGGTYTPDYLVIDRKGIVSFEVKEAGAKYHGWEQGIERYKRAAALMDDGPVRFCICEFDRKANEWHFTWWRGEGKIEF